MGETQDKIYPEAKFFCSCKSVKSNKLCDSKIQCWDRCDMDISISKGKDKKKRRDDGFQASPKSSRANHIRILRLKNIPPWLDAMPSGPTGMVVLFSSSPAL